MIPQQTTRMVLPLTGIALTVWAFVFATRDHSEARLIEALLAAVGIVLVWVAALAVRLRDPKRPLNRLMFALAIIYALQVFVTSSNPWLYTLGRAVRPLTEGMLIWVMLAFPTGRLPTWSARAVVAVVIVMVPALWLLGMSTASAIPMGGRFVTCTANCPENILFMADHPQLSDAAYTLVRIIGIIAEFCAAFVLLARLGRATPLMRHTLAPVLLASVARTLSVAVFLLFGHGTVVLTVTFWMVPAAIVLGQIRGRLFMGAALQGLVAGLRAQPDASRLRDVIANALGDRRLDIVYWSNEHAVWLRDNGLPVVPEQWAAETRRVITPVRDAQDKPVAALLHDEAIHDEPRLPEAVASSMLVALESLRTRTELETTQTQAVTAAASERKRIERDLHDGAQQRLIALRIKLGVARRLLDHDARRALLLLEELDTDTAAALEELRALAHGVAPPLLNTRGLSPALQKLARRAAIPTQALITHIGRIDAAAEATLYFCCAEALQNAAKHAGSGASARLQLWIADGRLFASIDDDGPGFEAQDAPGAGAGLQNMRQRIASIGGSVEFGIGPRGGTSVEFSVALARVSGGPQR